MDLVILKIIKERSVVDYVATFMVIKTLLGSVVYDLDSHPTLKQLNDKRKLLPAFSVKT